jgi:hypothetical protein
LASKIAGQTLEVRCYEHHEADDPLDSGAWAYVYLASPVVYLSKESCDGALALASGSMAPLWQQALGALTLTHEAYHLKLALPLWRRGSEAQTECRAVKRVRQSIVELGASEALADAVLPWALAEHFKLTGLAPEYDWPGCLVPVFSDFWG